MTIDEAKIYLSIQVELKHRLGKDFEAKCLQLGLEALKRVKECRYPAYPDFMKLLPSETEPEPQPTRDEVRKYMNERSK